MSNNLQKLSFGGVLVAMGVVFGDIGTSPLYTMKAIFGQATSGSDIKITQILAFGAVSTIFWLVTLQTTIKYLLIALQADNKGEGGIFAIYSLVKNFLKNNTNKLLKYSLVVVAILGAGMLLADGIITPPISISSSMEGSINMPFLQENAKKGNLGIFQQFIDIKGDIGQKHDDKDHGHGAPLVKPEYLAKLTPTQMTQVRAYWKVPFSMTLAILLISAIFAIQRFGTEIVGKAFGPVMFLWFGFLGAIGIYSMSLNGFDILGALNPYWAFKLMTTSEVNIKGIFIVGAAFLSITGAEALYSDLGHCGKKNIQISWIMVKACIVLTYMGQGSYLLTKIGQSFTNIDPFYDIIPSSFLPLGVILTTLATIVASQALITGSFTLIAEAIKLKFLPKIEIRWPTNHYGQIYIPFINNLLWASCIAVVLLFQTAEYMEGAYGFAITIAMITTSVFIAFFAWFKTKNLFLVLLYAIPYFVIEILFTVINGAKLVQVSKSGEVDSRGMIVILASGILFLAMFGYYLARQIVANLKETTREINSDEYLALTGESPNFVDNLVVDCDKYTKTKQVTNGLNAEGLFAKNYVFLEMIEYNEPNHFHLKKEKMSPNTTKFWIEYGFKDNLDLNKVLQKELAGSIHYASFNYKLKNATGFEGFCLNIYVQLEKLAQKFDYKFNVKKHQLNQVEIIVD